MDNVKKPKLDVNKVKFADNPPQPTKVHDVDLSTPVKDRPDAAAYHMKNILSNGKRQVKTGVAVKDKNGNVTKSSVMESLENLNVSEACFDDIVESIFKAIEKKVQDPKKREELTNKACSNLAKERYSSQNRDFAGKDKYEARELMAAKRDNTKNGPRDEDI